MSFEAKAVARLLKFSGANNSPLLIQLGIALNDHAPIVLSYSSFAMDGFCEGFASAEFIFDGSFSLRFSSNNNRIEGV